MSVLLVVVPRRLKRSFFLFLTYSAFQVFKSLFLSVLKVSRLQVNIRKGKVILIIISITIIWLIQSTIIINFFEFEEVGGVVFSLVFLGLFLDDGEFVLGWEGSVGFVGEFVVA